MKVTENDRTIHAYVEQFAPITTAELADRVEIDMLAAKGRVSAMVNAKHLVAAEHRAFVGGQWVLQWKTGPVPLPPTPVVPESSGLMLVGDDEEDPAERRVRVSQAAKERATRLRVFERAVDAGLKPTVDSKRGWRVSVPHPLGEPGRVWLDDDADLDLVLADLAGGPSNGPRGYDLGLWLPGPPLLAWVKGPGRWLAEAAGSNRAVAKAVERIARGAQATVSLAWAERHIDHLGGTVEGIWGDIDDALEEGARLRARSPREHDRAAA